MSLSNRPSALRIRKLSRYTAMPRRRAIAHCLEIHQKKSHWRNIHLAVKYAVHQVLWFNRNMSSHVHKKTNIFLVHLSLDPKKDAFHVLLWKSLAQPPKKSCGFVTEECKKTKVFLWRKKRCPHWGTVLRGLMEGSGSGSQALSV